VGWGGGRAPWVDLGIPASGSREIAPDSERLASRCHHDGMTSRDLRHGRASHLAIPLVLAAGLLAGALAGCSDQGGEEPDAIATPSSTPSVSAGGAVPAEGPLDHDQACAVMYVSGETPLEQRIGDALVNASQNFDVSAADTMHALAIELGQLEDRVPDDMAAALAKVRVPFTQLQEHLDAATGEDVQLDIASATDGLKELRTLCS
jgi:hypothetical protein